MIDQPTEYLHKSEARELMNEWIQEENHKICCYRSPGVYK